MSDALKTARTLPETNDTDALLALFLELGCKDARIVKAGTDEEAVVSGALMVGWGDNAGPDNEQWMWRRDEESDGLDSVQELARLLAN